MFKLYNNNVQITNTLNNFFGNCSNLSKPITKVLPFVITSIINSESVVTSDISRCINYSSFSINDDSNQKRIRRFFNNYHFDIYSFYSSVIKNIINNAKCFDNNKVFITIDHMFTKNNWVNLVFTLKVGNQGLPIYFRCEYTKSNVHSLIYDHSRKKLFNTNYIINCIKDVISLFNERKDLHLVFLADRWFINSKIMKFIDDNKCTYCIRAKANTDSSFLIFNDKEKHYIRAGYNYFTPWLHKARYFTKLFFSHDNIPCNLAIARSCKTNDPWYILTNTSPKQAISYYKFRFGSIETVFKSQKTNGFNLERTQTKKLHAYETLYGLVCLATTWLTIIGADYTKNYNHIKNRLNIRCIKHSKSGKVQRIISLFNLGLTIFHRVFNSTINFPIKCNFQLYG